MLTDGNKFARLHLQQCKEAGRQPNFPRRRNTLLAAEISVGLCGPLQRTPEWVSRGNCLDRRERHPLAIRHSHRRKTHRFGDDQAKGLRVFTPIRRDRRTTDHHHICGEETGALREQRGLEPCDKATDTHHDGNRQHQSQQQNTELTAAPIARQQPPGQRLRHGSRLTARVTRPPSSKNATRTVARAARRG